MKLLVLNAHSAQNAGDLAILQETLICLRGAFPDAEITIAINDELATALPNGVAYVGSFMRWLLRVDTQGEWHWRKPLVPFYALWLALCAVLYRLLHARLMPQVPERQQLMRAYYDADAIVVIGGGHLYARHAANIAFVWLWLGIALAVLMRKPLVLLPQSFGPLPGTVQRAMLRWLLSRSALVVAREYRSLGLLAEIGLRRRVLVMPDLAFAAASADPVDLNVSVLNRCAGDRPVVGVTLMDWQGQNPDFHNQPGYQDAMLSLIQHVQDRYDAEIVLFAQCTGPTAAQDDRRIARQIVAEARSQGCDRVTLVDAALSPEALKAAYAQLDLLVATRMHSAIFALSSNVPALVIGYLHKSVGIMEMLGLERHALDIDTIDAALLCRSFDALWAERAFVRCRLAERIPAMQQTLAQLPLLVRQSVQEA
jgi:colanic acid/amylovoran biosynthesis protein